MKERPILFSAPMVRAILSGQKTVTRRPVDPKPDGQPMLDKSDGKWFVDGGLWCRACPYGQPGDRLWVRENAYIAPPDFGDADQCDARDNEGRRRIVNYSASMDSESKRCAEDYGVKQTPSIHMPRWACRLVLEVTDVRAERLHQITDEGALLEGIDSTERKGQPKWFLGGTHKVKGTPKVFYEARTAFADLWSDTHGRESWDANPWVWVVSFRRVV